MVSCVAAVAGRRLAVVAERAFPPYHDVTCNRLLLLRMKNLLQQRHLQQQQQRRAFVSMDSYRKEGSAIARALQFMKDTPPRVVVHVQKASLVGCSPALLPKTAEWCVQNAPVRIQCLTHVDAMSKPALLYQIATLEELERQKYEHRRQRQKQRNHAHNNNSNNTTDEMREDDEDDYWPTAIIALNLQNSEDIKAKQLRPVSEALLGAARLADSRPILVCGVPNSGKSSLILPLTRNRTLTVRNKKGYHLPKVSNRAGMTVAIKKHVLEGGPSTGGLEATLLDTPGLRPRLDNHHGDMFGTDPRVVALFLAAHVTEVFPGYHEWTSRDLIFETLLRASNRHAALTANANGSGSTQQDSTAAAAAAAMFRTPYMDMLGFEQPTHDAQQFIQAYLKHEQHLKVGSDDGGDMSKRKSNKTKFNEKALMRRFHSGEFGGLVFTPSLSPQMDATVKMLAAQIQLLQNNSASSSSSQHPIVYMNPMARFLVDVAHGRI